jgi:hypothetical protein
MLKITPEGSVKVLDFGLAKIYEPSSVQNISDSPTPSAGLTARPGVNWRNLHVQVGKLYMKGAALVQTRGQDLARLRRKN